jgi:HK97 family phage major capsid protein
MPDKVKEYEERLTEFIGTWKEKQLAMKEEIATENKQSVEEVQNRITEIEAALKAEINDRIMKIRVNNISLPGLDDDKDKDRFSFSKAAFAVGQKDFKNASFEEDIFRQTREKAVDSNTGTSGGYLIPVELAMDKIIMPAIANTVMRGLGADFMEGLTSDIDIPEASSRPILNWGPEGAEATAQNITFALQPLRPKEGNMLVKVSNKLLMQQGVAEAKVRMLMQEGATDGIDKITIQGGGTDSEPLGIENASGTNTTAIGSARMTIDQVATMIEDVQEQNYLKRGDAGLLTRPKVLGGLRRQLVKQYSADTAGMPIVVPIMSDQALKDLTGANIWTTTNVSESSNLTKAIIGEWSYFTIGIWGGMRLKASDVAGASFASNQTWFVMFVDVDSRVTQPLAFNIGSNVSTNF